MMTSSASLMHKKSLKTQNNSWHASRMTQRSIDRSEHVYLQKYPVRVMSVAVITAVVQQCTFLLAFVVL